MLRAALFDLDGTLVLTNIDFAAMKRDVLAVAREHGVDLAHLAHRDSLFLVGEAKGRAGDAGAELEARAFASVEVHERASLPRARVAVGAPELLAWLRSRGVKVAIVTRNGGNVARELVERFGLVADVLLTRDEVAHVKPDPRHLHDALARLSCEPAVAVMVGDHAMDIAAGRAAGVARAIGVAHDDAGIAPLAAAAPDALVRSLVELRDVLSTLVTGPAL
jgi:phosphoglycolate phosphatase